MNFRVIPIEGTSDFEVVKSPMVEALHAFFETHTEEQIQESWKATERPTSEFDVLADDLVKSFKIPKRYFD